MGLFFGLQNRFFQLFSPLLGLQTDFFQAAHVRQIVGSHGQYKYLVDSILRHMRYLPISGAAFICAGLRARSPPARLCRVA
jgi:hypothetical protein